MQRVKHVLKHCPEFSEWIGAVQGHHLLIKFRKQWRELPSSNHSGDLNFLRYCCNPAVVLWPPCTYPRET